MPRLSALSRDFGATRSPRRIRSKRFTPPREPSNSTEELNLFDEHVEILRDVIGLREEVQILRTRLVSLKDAQLLNNKVICDSDMEFEYHAQALSAAIGHGKLSRAINGFQRQTEVNYDRMSNIKIQLTDPVLCGFSVEVEECRAELIAMKQDIAASETTVEDIHHQIDGIRSDYPKRCFIDQRAQIESLEQQIDDAIARHSQLKKEVTRLQHGRRPVLF
jgi:hypothetical protein